MATEQEIRQQKAVEALGIDSLATLEMHEADIIKGLMEAATFKDDAELTQLVRIERKHKLLFQFRIRPISEADMLRCRRKATKYHPNPNGKNLPKIPGEVDAALFRSYVIYDATIPEDRAKVWDNPSIRSQLSVIEGAEVIDRALLAGEKERVFDLIEELSGYGDQTVSIEEYAKN